jgi:hypothetical protein
VASSINQTYTDFVTPVPAVWLNNVNAITNSWISPKGPLFGAVGDGVTDDTLAMQNALTYCSLNKLTLLIPPGTYKISSQLVCGPVQILGCGNRNTTLYFPNNSGIFITIPDQYHSFQVRDLTITAGLAGGGNAGLEVFNSAASILGPATFSPSTIDNVVMCGSDGLTLTNYWAQGIVLENTSNVTFTNVMINGSTALLGTAVNIFGDVNHPPVVFNFTNCAFNFVTVGIEYGNYVQGMTVTGCNFTGGALGIFVPSGQTQLVQLAVQNSQFNNTQCGINLLTEMPDCLISNNLFLIPGPASGNPGIGIQYITAHRGTCYGNSFAGYSNYSNTIGVVVEGNAAPMIISTNSFQYCGTAVSLTSGSTGNNVQSNVYGNNVVNVANAGVNNVIGGGSD